MYANETGGSTVPGRMTTRERSVRLRNDHPTMNRQEAKRKARKRSDRLKKLIYTIQSSGPEDLDMILGGAIRAAKSAEESFVHIEFNVSVHGGRPWATNLAVYELDHGEYPPHDREYRTAAIVLPSEGRLSLSELRNRVVSQLHNNRAVHRSRFKKIETIEEHAPEGVA